MFEFLRIQYRLGALDDAGLARYAKAGWITADQYRRITGKELI